MRSGSHVPNDETFSKQQMYTHIHKRRRCCAHISCSLVKRIQLLNKRMNSHTHTHTNILSFALCLYITFTYSNYFISWTRTSVIRIFLYIFSLFFFCIHLNWDQRLCNCTKATCSKRNYVICKVLSLKCCFFLFPQSKSHTKNLTIYETDIFSVNIFKQNCVRFTVLIYSEIQELI